MSTGFWLASRSRTTGSRSRGANSLASRSDTLTRNDSSARPLIVSPTPASAATRLSAAFLDNHSFRGGAADRATPERPPTKAPTIATVPPAPANIGADAPTTAPPRAKASHHGDLPGSEGSTPRLDTSRNPSPLLEQGRLPSTQCSQASHNSTLGAPQRERRRGRDLSVASPPPPMPPTGLGSGLFGRRMRACGPFSSTASSRADTRLKRGRVPLRGDLLSGVDTSMVGRYDRCGVRCPRIV